MRLIERKKRKWSRSVVSDSVIPWTVAYQASLSMGFSRQEYQSGLPLPSPEWGLIGWRKVLEYKKQIPARRDVRAGVKHSINRNGAEPRWPAYDWGQWFSTPRSLGIGELFIKAGVWHLLRLMAHESLRTGSENQEKVPQCEGREHAPLFMEQSRLGLFQRKCQPLSTCREAPGLRGQQAWCEWGCLV